MLSIIVPAYNEASNIAPLVARVDRTMTNAGLAYELIFVDDGSTDETLERIRAACETNSNIRFSSLSRNFGHEAASSCGFHMCRGDAAVLMDADLQDPPEIIPDMVAKWRDGYDVVFMRRRRREGESAFKKTTAKLFYQLINRLASIDIPVDVGDFRLVSRRAVDIFNQLPERNRFVRGLFAWVGFKQTAMEYDRPQRLSGDTKYNPVKLLLLSIDAIFSHSLVPLRICTLFGVAVSLLSLLIMVIVVFQRLFGELTIPGYAMISTGLFFLGGTMLISLGVIGEYVGRTYMETQGRPLYIVDQSSDGD